METTECFQTTTERPVNLFLQHDTESLRGFHYVPHTRNRVTQSLTVSMTTSLQLHSYSQFPIVLRDQGDKGAGGGNSTRLNGG